MIVIGAGGKRPHRDLYELVDGKLDVLGGGPLVANDEGGVDPLLERFSPRSVAMGLTP